MLVDPDKYLEKPRPDLYSIVQKLKYDKKSYRRLCYVAKVSEQALKGDLEKDMNAYFKKVAGDGEFTGLCLVLANYIVHLIETDDEKLMETFVTSLNDEVLSASKFYLNIDVIHFQEEYTT
jgi:hypothetical protein